MNQAEEESNTNSVFIDIDSQQQSKGQPNSNQAQVLSSTQAQDVSQIVDSQQDKYFNINYTEANNLQSLDEIMNFCNSSKARSSSITVDQKDLGSLSGKHLKDKDEILSNFSLFPKLNIEKIQISQSYSYSDRTIDASNKNQDQDQLGDNFLMENKASKTEYKGCEQLQQEFQKNEFEMNEEQNATFQGDSQELTSIQHKNQSIPPLHENRMAKLKNRMNLNIQPQAAKSGDLQQGSNQKEKANFSSPINEIQSDNSSSSNQKDKLNIEELMQENKKHNLILDIKNKMHNQNQDQDEAEELVQNDEFTKMFQSNCPIKSPTLPKPKKKLDQSQHKMNSSLEISTERKQNSSSSTIKEDLSIKGEINSQLSKQTLESDIQNYCQTNNNNQEAPQIQSLSQVDKIPNTHDNNQGIQLSFIADIKSVRNSKVNAFRSRLTLSQHEADNEEFRKKSSTISVDLLQMQEPISIKDLQKNYSSHTTETPLTNKKNLQVNQKRQSYSKSFKSDFQIDETNDEYKDVEQSQIHQQQMNNEVVTSLEKTVSRRFERKDLRIKVNPVKDQEKEDVWDSDDLTSNDQNAQEEPIVTKAKQGSHKFEDIYYLLNGKPLGEGTSGCVYQCKKLNQEDETVYAVKVMRNVDEEMSKSIFQTFGIQYRLQHEYISRVYEVYFNEDNQTVHYVMDFIPFRTLDSVVKDKRRNMKETEASGIIQKLLKAVMYMEQRGVCHRDLKPENILISEDLQQLKIIDFGISKSFVKSQRVQHITQYYKHKMYTPTGTPHYKAPEILLGAGYTQLVDMWAVGIIAYQLIAKGKHPFKCDSNQEQDARIMKYQFDQTDEGWVNASSNAKNFIKSLLRPNRMPAFEALKHPWIEQRKIEVPADDDNHSSNKQEKKPINDNMTISVPTLFLQKQFNHFGITVTNSEQRQRSGFLKRANQGENYDDSIPLRACNTIQSTNEFDLEVSGNSNIQISNYGIQSQNQNNNVNEQQNLSHGKLQIQIQGLNNNLNSSEQVTPVLGKKKHNIQGFASTQDVVHVVMRQKLSESKEKMMQFFLKANAIIKSLEEEKLQQQNSLKRTHSAEKQSDSPQSPEEVYSKPLLNNSINQGMQAFSIYKNNSIGFNPQKDDPVALNSSGFEQNQQSIFMPQQIIQQQNYTQGSIDEQTRNKIKLNNSFAGQQNLQNILSKGAQSSLQSLGKNTSINEGNSSMQINQSMNNAMIYSTSDFSNMKFSSLMSRKTTNINKKGIIEKRYVRRNSQQQTNCMEKSIIFTKEVIGELQKDPAIQETIEQQQILLNSTLPFTIGQSISNSEGQNNEQQQMTDSIQLKNFNPNYYGNQNIKRFSSYARNQQQNLNNAQLQQNSASQSINQQIRLSMNTSRPIDIFSKGIDRVMNEEEIQKEKEKWNLIQNNMDQKSDSSSGDDDSDGDRDDSSDGNNNDSNSSCMNHQSGDNTFITDITKFMILNPNQNNQFNQSEVQKNKKDESSSQVNQQEQTQAQATNPENQNQKNENLNLIVNKINGDTSSLSNIGSEEQKDQEKKSLSQSPINSQNQSKNNSQNQQGGIFQSAPYTNYMNSSKDDKINQTLLSIQNPNSSNVLQPAAVLTTNGGIATKENISSNSSLSGKVENQPNKIKNQNNQDEKQQNQQVLKDSMNSSQQNQNNLLSCVNCNQSNLNCSNCENQFKIDTILETHVPDVTTSQKINSNLNQNVFTNQQLNQKRQIDTSQIIDEKVLKQKQNQAETSILESSACNNLSFIEMNNSNIFASPYNQYEDFLNTSLKKNTNLLSMNVSQASSINANISLSGSANSGNTIRSLHAMTNANNNQHGNSNNTNSDCGSIHLQQVNQKDKSNSSKFKQSDYINNSQFKKPHNKFDLDMSESQSYTPQENPLQTSIQRQILDSGLNTSNEVTPSKLINGLSEDIPQNSLNLAQQNVQSFNSGHSEHSKESSQGSKNQQIQQNSHLMEDQNIAGPPPISPNKKNLSQQIDAKDDSQSDKSSFKYSNQSGNNSLDGQQKQQDLQREQQNTLNSKLNQKYKYLNSNYSTITEESDIKSCLSSSIAQSQKIGLEFESTNLSIGQHFNKQNYTRSMTQMVQSNSEKNENSQNNYSGQNNIASSTSTISTNQCNITTNLQLKELKQRQDNNNQAGQSLDEFDSNDDLEQQHNNETKSQLLDSNNSQKKLNSSSFKNSGFQKMSSQQGTKSSPHFNNTKNLVSNQLDEVFGQMQNSSSFMKQEEEFDINVGKQIDRSKSPFNSKSHPALSPNNKQISSLQNSSEIEQLPSLFSEQPPILKHRSSSRLLEMSVGLQQVTQSRDLSDDHNEVKNESSQKPQFYNQDLHKIEVIPELKYDEGEVDNSNSDNADLNNEKKIDEQINE
ncbi:Serine/Threonine kinase domain protein (macronuclear) [Tetrahymena thermophila SB210]|uniref:Serine/Threonine kinase domain protein n=1 Tax=Tetrahymena thermophila (strain SB210) TaxID=312017 RepID=I7MN00_TETTS|nr:Serine/Threonine kinase domain protein [Tetrahymena thermophila SB210]EAS07642.2 Serine/Threonine kinase domain protein [Tetrahymena thermophila SB210]|eukprot:XP_001027884.2 Serine/Threonine kinase domain protein [Tetrahymena thermophila SB210]